VCLCLATTSALWYVISFVINGDRMGVAVYALTNLVCHPAIVRWFVLRMSVSVLCEAYVFYADFS
jgi:hypothetical protein